jgi:hypothetical protein
VSAGIDISAAVKGVGRGSRSISEGGPGGNQVDNPLYFTVYSHNALAISY